jgi:hypothetical protein
MRRNLIAEKLELSLRASLAAPSLRLVALEGERPASDEVREPWIPIKYGPASPDAWFGVVPATARVKRTRGSAVESLALVVKVNPREGLARTLIPWIIAHQKIALDRPYWEYRTAAESDRTGAREQRLYELADETPALRRVLPRCYGSAADTATGEHALFLELLGDVARLDAAGATADWPAAAIDDALRAAAGWHAAFWDIDAKRGAWAGPRPTTADMVADAPLWRGLLDDARARFPQVVTEQAWRRRHVLIATLPDWHAPKDRLPATLVHDDFNQRNVGFRPQVVVLDWELVQRNTAQRDLVEMLTFVLPASADRAQVDRHVETHRLALVEAGIAAGIERDPWIEGFRCELKVEAINRVGIQLLFGAQFPLAYLARINATIERLLDLYVDDLTVRTGAGPQPRAYHDAAASFRAGQNLQHAGLLFAGDAAHDRDRVPVGAGGIEIFDDPLGPLAVGDELRVVQRLFHRFLQEAQPRRRNSRRGDQDAAELFDIGQEIHHPGPVRIHPGRLEDGRPVLEEARPFA